MSKRYVIHCDACGYNTVISGANDTVGLHEVKLAPIPGGVPVYDEKQKKTITKKSTPRRKMFKCKKCGRGIIVRDFMVPEIKDVPSEEKDNNDGREAGPSGQPLP